MTIILILGSCTWFFGKQNKKLSLFHLDLNFNALKTIKDNVCLNSNIGIIQWKDSVNELDEECKKLKLSIELRLIKNILNKNKTETDLSHFDVNVFMLKLVEKFRQAKGKKREREKETNS